MAAVRACTALRRSSKSKRKSKTSESRQHGYGSSRRCLALSAAHRTETATGGYEERDEEDERDARFHNRCAG